MTIKEEVKEIVDLRKLVASANKTDFFNLLTFLKKKDRLDYSDDAIDIVKMMYDIDATVKSTSSRGC